MNKQKINYVVDVAMFASLITTMLSIFLGDRKLHALFGEIFFVLFLIHLAMHWKMFLAMHKNISSGSK